MSTTNLHVVPHEAEGWAVKLEGVAEPISTHSAQNEAIDAAVDATIDDALKVVIHRKDGRFREVMTVTSESDDQNPQPDLYPEYPVHRVEYGQKLVKRKTRIRWGAVFAGFLVAIAMTSRWNSRSW